MSFINTSTVLAADPNPAPEIQPTPDRLAIPVLSDNPTQVEVGNSVYYYHCMPCHGDRGQGLTDEFREAVWVEDHQDCWASGCHGGRYKDEGFPIPRYIPGVLNLAFFEDPEALFSYLQETHPPQRPGALLKEEYWAATAFLLNKSGRLPDYGWVGDLIPSPRISNEQGLVAYLAITLLIGFLVINQAKRKSED